eukprot:5634368-Prymnesium_polylepis.2
MWPTVVGGARVTSILTCDPPPPTTWPARHVTYSSRDPRPSPFSFLLWHLPTMAGPVQLGVPQRASQGALHGRCCRTPDPDDGQPQRDPISRVQTRAHP